MEDASMFRLGMIASLILLCLLVSAPILVEALLSCLSIVTRSRVRDRSSGQALIRMALKASDAAEYGVATGVVLGLLSGIYFHATVIHHHGHDAWPELLLFHVLPSLWINSATINFFCRAATLARGNPEDHHCPLVANAIGHNNYQFFFGFVVWIWLAMAYATWITHYPWVACRDSQDVTFHCSGNEKSLFFLSSALCILCFIFMCFIIWLLVSGRTMKGLLDPAVEEPYRMVPTTNGGWTTGKVDRIKARLGPPSIWWRYAVPFALVPGTHTVPSLVHK